MSATRETVEYLVLRFDDGPDVFIAPEAPVIYRHVSTVGPEYDFETRLDSDREVDFGDTCMSRASFRAWLQECTAALDATEPAHPVTGVLG